MNRPIDIVGAAETALDRHLAGAQVERLSGGYSWQTYLVLAASVPVAVVRVAPGGGTLSPYDVNDEQRALQAAAGSVPAPQVLLVEAEPSVYGAPLQVQTVAPGSALRRSLIKSPAERRPYRIALAGALGALHRDGDPGILPGGATSGDAIHWVIDTEIGHYVRAAPARNPGFEIGLRWLLSNLPDESGAAVVCHGDFRLNNVLWTAPGRIGGVIDWERAWAGDPLCDIAFTRHFSGWAAVDREAVGVYEQAAGRTVDESRMTFYLRLERWRSYTAAMRGRAAVAAAESDEVDLLAIGEAGIAGTWDLVNWLEDGLVSLPSALEDRSAAYADGIGAARRRELMMSLDADHPLRARFADARGDQASIELSIAMLRTVSGLPRLAAALRDPEPQVAWERAFEVMTEEATHGGRSLHAALQALGLRFTNRPTTLPEMTWR